jgi:hypothetical protein
VEVKQLAEGCQAEFFVREKAIVESNWTYEEFQEHNVLWFTGANSKLAITLVDLSTHTSYNK